MNKIRGFEDPYVAPTPTHEGAGVHGRDGILPARSLWEQMAYREPGVDVRPVLRNFVQAMAGYLRDRVNEVHGTSGGCYIYPAESPSVMVRFRALKTVRAGDEAEHIKTVKQFIHTALHRVSCGKVDMDRAYAWQRTKLLR
jgi:hypothetical protein